MNPYTDYSASELLTFMLDGELDGTQETALFATLANSDELKTQLHELLSIREAIRKDTEAFTSPAEATEGVFAHLGYNNPFPGYLAPAGVAKVGNAFAGFFKKVWVPALSAFLATILTVYFISNYYEGSRFNSSKNIPVVGSVESTSETVYKPSASNLNPVSNLLAQNNEVLPDKNSINLSEARNNINNNRNSGLSNKATIAGTDNVYDNNSENGGFTANNNVLNESDNNNINNINNIKDNIPNPDLNDNPIFINRISNESGIYNSYKMNPGSLSNRNAPQTFGFANTGNSNESGQKKLFIQAKGLYARSVPETNYIGSSIPVSFDIFMNSSESLQYGFSFGWESFAKIHLDRRQSNIATTEDVGSTFLFGIGARYELRVLSIFTSLHPFGQIFVGASQSGPLAKLALGMQYDIFTNFAMTLGIESGLLVYENKNIFYSPGKIGMSYGIIVKM